MTRFTPRKVLKISFVFTSVLCLVAAFLCTDLLAQETPAMVNVSTRGIVGTGQDVMIAGFIINGVGPRRVAIRVLGPTLTNYGVPGVLSDPVLALNSGQTVIASNDEWQSDATSAAALRAASLAPTSNHEPAIVTTLAPGAYTATVSGKNETTGVALVEVYDLDARDNTGVSTSRTFNLSTRGRVGTGDQVMILGFVIGGTTPRDVLISAIAGSLAEYGVTNPLSDSKLEIHDGSGKIIATGDDWIDSPDFDKIASTGASPRDPLEAAVWLHLVPGLYTAIVSGAGGAQGVALPELEEIRTLTPVQFAPSTLADRTGKLAIATGTTATTLTLVFTGSGTVTVNAGTAGTYTYVLHDNYRADLNGSAGGYVLKGTLQFYRDSIGVFDGTLAQPGASAVAAGGVLVVQ